MVCHYCGGVFVFFFKQKTAYEMRISDWSSDVCSSDLDLAKRIDTTDEWIRQRTGIHQRHVAADGEMTSDLGTAAAREAMAQAGVRPGDIDLIVCATSTPDETFPATAKIGRAHV